MWNVLQVLNQDDTPLLYSLVFGEGIVNDATSVVLFRAVQNYNFDAYTALEALQVAGNFLYLFFTSTVFGALVIHFLFTSHMCYDWSLLQCLTYLS
jgi:sodium/hydrogen exchanger 8